MTRTLTRREILVGGSALIAATALACDGNHEAHDAALADALGDAGVDGSAADQSSDGPPTDAGRDAPDAREARLDAAAPAPWKLAAGHFVPAKMPLAITNPRPNNERGATSIYSWAHEAVPYEVPITVVGGAWPFCYELASAPSGMTIGQQLLRNGDALERPADYGVVRWIPPAGSNGQRFSYTVRVTDQDDHVTTVDVELEVQNGKFVFVAPDDGSPSGEGSLPRPLRGFAALYGPTSTDATYAGRLTYFRGGAYTLSGGSDTNNNAQLGGEAKSKVWRAFPGEQPVFDCSASKVLFNGGAMDDCCFDGLRWEHGRQDVDNAHFIWATTRFDRGLFWRNHFYELQKGLVGNDNPAAIFFPAPGGHRHYTVVLSNVFERLGPGGGNGVAAYDSYGQDYALFEHNVAEDCSSSYCLWLKGGHRFTTVRGERAFDGNAAGVVLMNIACGMDGGTLRSESVEVSYCAVASPTGHAFRFSWATTADENGPTWIYRCTVKGTLGALNTDSADVTLERCVFTDAAPPAGATTQHVELLTATDGELDAELRLVGALRQNALGTHGHELA